MMDWSRCQAVERTPGKVGGESLFKGTRVPARALFENLEGGATIDDFPEWFPGVTREQAETRATPRRAKLACVSSQFFLPPEDEDIV